MSEFKFEAKDFFVPADVSRWRTIALGVGGIFTIIWAIGLFFDMEQALRSWLLGFTLWGGIGIGGLGILILQYLTGGAWGVVIRRTVEACSRTIIILFILFLPILFGVTHLYEWTHLHDAIIEHRSVYLNVPFWMFRAVLYFALLFLLSFLLNKWSRQQDETMNYEDAAKYLGSATKLAGPGMILFILVVTFASIDWTMSMNPHWFSTIWGFLFVAGWALSCFAFSITILALLSDKQPLNHILGKRHFHDIGKLIFALVMVWAYFNFSQYLIIWAGNIPEETRYYMPRQEWGVWGIIGLVLLLFHFAFPFLLLLSRDLKRNAKWLAVMSVLIILMRLLDYFYTIAPSPRIALGGQEGVFILSWMDFVAPLAIGGIWLWWFFGELMKRPIVPIHDPFLENAIEHGKDH